MAKLNLNTTFLTIENCSQLTTVESQKIPFNSNHLEDTALCFGTEQSILYLKRLDILKL